MIAATVILITLAYLAYRSATPGNGLLLVSGILGAFALIALLSIPKLDRQDERLETMRRAVDDMRSTARSALAQAHGGPPQGADLKFRGSSWDGAGRIAVSFECAEPEVHRVDSATLEEARRLMARGAPIDDICRLLDPEFDGRGPAYQEAFRGVARAMIEQA